MLFERDFNIEVKSSPKLGRVLNFLTLLIDYLIINPYLYLLLFLRLSSVVLVFKLLYLLIESSFV